MKTYFLVLIVCALCVCFVFSNSSYAQGTSTEVGIGAKVSTLGIGGEVGVSVTRRSNVRVGFNYFTYSRTFHKRGITYNGDVDLRSLQITYDQYLVGGLHISPALLPYNGMHIDTVAGVPPGQSFTLGGVTYFSGQTNPIGGTGKMNIRKTAPAVFLGYGNIVPRSDRHLGFNVEAGVVFSGSPTTKLALTGNACVVNPTTGCLNAGTDPTVQANVQNEQAKLNDDLKPFQYYPVVSAGISWKF